ncbi:hypothetical protein ACE7GA_05050 [Roseomonas sp. CCTCC AB2023176]|uniref:hypothetical protein n=1 Tax=Roseomonas sp. CCTCC AB2023176 TaxID=3342640 RepID=UPI0035D5FB59
MRLTPVAGLFAAALAATPALAQIVVSGNDGKRTLIGGVNTLLREARPDTVAVLDLNGAEPRLVAEIPVPHSVVGPPQSVAVTPDERLALATSAERLDPNDPSKTVPDNRLSVIDLRANPPRVVRTLEVGLGPSGVGINPAGTLALVANRNAGTVSVIRLDGMEASVVGTVTIGPATTGTSAAVFTADGRHALVTRDNDSIVSVLRVDGNTVTKLDRDMTAGVRPYGASPSPRGGWAVVGNVGRSANNTGDRDTVSLIDLSREPFRVVDTVAVGSTTEGVMASPDGRHAVAVVHNGSSRPNDDPLRARAAIVLIRVEEGRMRVVGEARIGDWAQGMAFSRNGRTLLVGNMADRTIGVYEIGEDGIRDTNRRIELSSGPAALATGFWPR